MTASIRASSLNSVKYTNSNFRLLRINEKEKRTLDNAQKAKKRKIEAQQTRTLDLLKDLCKKN